MNIYTGHFSKLKTYLENDLFPISICRKAPNWYSGTQYKKLAPSWDIFSKYKSGTYSVDDYKVHFPAECLNNLNKQNVIEELTNLSGQNDIILLCYEKPGKFCHRHLVAKWLSEVKQVSEFSLQSNKNLLEFFNKE